ncbi:MAG: Na/Pi cotransporter family protein [Rhodobacteraceae bacterium]|nr:Na/Pi cotransporter family protein [Paracoccaceae bacterium]
MVTLTFLMELAGATMLLLFAVRMVQTGIERSMGPSFRRIITSRKDSRLQMAFAGIMLAIVLQSATAASLLASGFLASALISFTGGLATVLGADLGSALIIQLLSLRPDWLIPVLLAVGGYLFLKVEARSPRQIGRILLGIAFILLALQLISASVDPIRESAAMPTIAAYLERDFVTAFLAGAAITFVMHSSVAAILMFVTFVAIGVLPVQAGVSVVLGANLGSAALFIWLSRGMGQVARRLPFANLLLRGSGSVLGLFVVNFTPIVDSLDFFADAQILVVVHVLFNSVVLVFSLPILRILERPFSTIFSDVSAMVPEEILKPASALDPSLLGHPAQAVASLTREVLRMSEMVSAMVSPVMDLYRSGDKAAIKAVRAADHEVNSALDGIRRYVADIDRSDISKDHSRRVRELVEYAISLEVAGDVVSKNLMVLATAKRRKGLKFSIAGREELLTLHERVMSNMTLAFNVLISEDLESARLLMEEKAEFARKERKSRKLHLKRMRDGSERSFETSDIHLETLRALKDLNARISLIAYPILYRNGQLLETRLVESVEEDESEQQESG